MRVGKVPLTVEICNKISNIYTFYLASIPLLHFGMDCNLVSFANGYQTNIPYLWIFIYITLKIHN